MKKVHRFFILFCFFAIMMSGCVSSNSLAQPLCRVVTQVDISCQKEQTRIHRHYTSQGKMEAVLLYLRLLRPLGTPETDPDKLSNETYEIRITLSDGKQKHYRQKAHRYLFKDRQGWKTIDPQLASQLYTLMRRLPSDPVFSARVSLAQMQLL